MQSIFRKSGVLILAALLCATLSAGAQAQNQTQPPARKQDILRTMERVADWELSHLDEAAYPKAPYADAADPIGWVYGTFYTGLTALADRSKNEKYADAIYALGAQKNWTLRDDRPFHADNQEMAQNWIWAYGRKKDPAMIATVRARFDAVIAANPSRPLMMVPTAPGNPGCFERWCWCDALFMAPPGWMMLSRVTGDPKYQAYADKEYKAVTTFLFDNSESLFFRDSSFFQRTGPHGEKIFWSRGNGWVYASLARILTILPANAPSRAFYRDLFLKMSRKLVTLQKADGSWAPSLLDPAADTLPETSGTAFFTYGMAWGVKAGLLKDAQYRRAAERGWARINRSVAPDGRVGWVQQVGSSPDSVRADHTQPFGVGAFLLAGVAMHDLAAR